MIIHRVAKHLIEAPALKAVMAELARGHDATLLVGQSARTLLAAALWAANPRPCLLIVSGEQTAERAVLALSAWLGRDVVCRYAARSDYPWSDTTPDDALIGARCRAIERLATGEPCLVVSSARALLRLVPPRKSAYFASATFLVGDEVPFEEVPDLLVGMGYSHTGAADEPGTFYVHGDSVDIFPAQATSPVRLEFFGDEIDRIRRMVSSTGQTIGELSELRVAPARELALTDQTIARAERALFAQAQENTTIEAQLELIRQRALDPTLERFLPELYGTTASPLEHMAKDTLVMLAEPRALFDDCQRAYDEISQMAHNARVSMEGLYTTPRELDFGKQQRVSFSSLVRTGSDALTAELELEQPGIAGADTRLISRLRQLLHDNYRVVFAIPDRGARESLEMRLNDEHIAFVESLTCAPENRAQSVTTGLVPASVDAGWPAEAVEPSEVGEAGEAGKLVEPAPLKRGFVSFIDAPVPAGIVITEAKLAILSISDLRSRSAKHHKRARRVDPTSVTFPFQPGDYVVHATHGIALFTQIVRQEVGGRERDYFLLEYAGSDKLYVPLEQVDRLSRYVGPDGSSPRLTRLNTADWSRATSKARASAKKLAFDLVDLYTRRASVTGHTFAHDNGYQREMEESFSYELTPDQRSALEDIKADMESAKPMDRLLCGDVGFGKTEVALRAAFKACQDGKQVMVLCPTTILAQQHFETFYARFRPFAVQVAVLSRFVTPSRQKKSLQAFAEGTIDVLVGTHRLLSADVNPHDLGLVIIDEEQRFGVQHKEQLKNLREQVDVLTLSATPIPRTMQMAMSGVRDMSLIMTPPPGRLPVKVQVGEYDPDTIAMAIRRELARKGQVYYVSNRVGTIEEAVARVIEATPEARVGFAHGQMSARQVEDVMLEFSEHEIDVLVATTIIESGIDNPHTNTLIIEDSQRLGLAQLYQLKGRVGRGRLQAYAYFMFPAELPLTPEATDRLTAINEYQDLGSGMKIAMRDLEIRGAGSLVGAEQHGNLSSVGFDLFTQMLGEAVAEARGETPDPEPSELTLNLSADFYLAEEYVPEIDKRVLLYRQLALAADLASLDRLADVCEKTYGALPLAARNLFDRARIRIRAERLGIQSISLTGGRILFQHIELSRAKAQEFKQRGCLYYATSHKLACPFRADREDLMPVCLSSLELIGGDDELDKDSDHAPDHDSSHIPCQ